MFESGEDREVNNGLIIMNEFIVPFLPLLLVDEMEEKDVLAVEDMRNRWCSYLGQEMGCKFKQCCEAPETPRVKPQKMWFYLVIVLCPVALPCSYRSHFPSLPAKMGTFLLPCTLKKKNKKQLISLKWQ